MRNLNPDNTFKNPENLSDYHGEKYKKKFERANSIHEERDSEGRIIVQVSPGMKPKLL